MAELKPKERRFALSTEERSEFNKLRSIHDTLYYQQEGIKRLMDVLMVDIQIRVNVAKEKAPEGMMRQFKFDSDKYELIVIDIPQPKGEPKIKDLKVT